MFVPLSQPNSVATVADADMKLGRCVVVRTKMYVAFKDGCGTVAAVHTSDFAAGMILLQMASS